MEQKNIVYRFQQIDNVHEIFIFDDIRKTGPFNWVHGSYDDSETSAKHFKELLGCNSWKQTRSRSISTAMVEA